jgi:RNA polymerase sigma factor (sigma-70 family)
MQPKPTVFVVDDDSTLRESIRFLVESIGLGVRTYGSAVDFLREFDPEAVGCLVTDVRMPGLSGLDLQRELLERGSKLPVIIMTAFAEVPTAVRALKEGAVDFIEKPFSDQLLLDRIQLAIERDREARSKSTEAEKLAARMAELTPRQREVMRLIVEGKPSKVIASELGLSPKTVEAHRSRVMSKMQAKSLAELVRLAVLAGTDKMPRED